MIIIVDYGMGNLHSILNMLKKIGAEAEVSADLDKIEMAERLILPGVGAFDSGMANLHSSGLIPVLNRKVLEKKTPILGICLGMQLMTSKSEEGVLPGLCWIKAETIRFDFSGSTEKKKIPHMGWNYAQIRKSNDIVSDRQGELRYYFVHSYHVVCANDEDISTVTNYGYDFVSSFQKGNLFGVQFHPEKSHKYGLEVMNNFSRL